MQQNSPMVKTGCKLLHLAGKSCLLVWCNLLHLAGLVFGIQPGFCCNKAGMNGFTAQCNRIHPCNLLHLAGCLENTRWGLGLKFLTDILMLPENGDIILVGLLHEIKQTGQILQKWKVHFFKCRIRWPDSWIFKCLVNLISWTRVNVPNPS